MSYATSRQRGFHSSTSTRIRTIRCTEHHSGARSQFPFCDVNEDSHHSVHRTPLWCPIATSILRRQQGFSPIDAQNTTLVPDRNFHSSTSTRIRTHRCAEHHSGAQSHISILRRQRGFAPFDAQNATLVADRTFLSSTSTRVRTYRCAERHSGARPQLPWNIFPRHPGSWVALFRPA